MVDRDAVRSGYDDLGDVYEAKRSPDPSAEAAIEALLERLPADACLLDAGCGHGEPVLCEASERVDAVGVDLSGGQLRRAAANVPEAGLVQGGLAALPVADDAVDAVTAFHSLIHVPVEDHPTVLGEFARVLRPGGEVLVTEGPEEWAGRNEDWLDSGAAMEWDIAGEAATREHLRSAGFEVVDRWSLDDELADEEAAKPLFRARLDQSSERRS